MPELNKIESSAAFTPEAGKIVTYFASESDKIVLKAKKSDGTVQTLSGAGGGGGGDGFQLVKVTDYTPSREELTAPSQIVISGFGTIGDETDASAANGTYVVTSETEFKSGLARIYKQTDGKYYLCGYDPSTQEYAEFETHWYISDTIGGHGWSSLVYVNGESIPNGEATWTDMNYGGSYTITTAVTETTYPALAETVTAYPVTAFDDTVDDWSTGEETTAVSDFTLTPQTDGIYFAQGGKLIGQHIDRELNIPTNGLVRRFKHVDGHFVDTIWGTEMLPSGDISYDELGYAGNNAAPYGNGSSYLSANNTLTLSNETTISAFFKYMGGSISGIIFGLGDKSNRTIVGIYGNSIEVGGWGQSYFDLGLKLGRWNHVLMTVKKDSTATANVEANIWCNGKLVKTITNTHGNNIGSPSHVGVLSASSCSQYSETISGQIDEACIWDRILTDEEIAEMAKGVKTFNWDIEVPEYVQKQPVFYAPLTENLDSMTGQASSGSISAGSGNPLSYPPFLNGGMCNYNTDGGDSGYQWGYYRTSFDHVYPAFFTSGDFTIMSEIYPISTHGVWANSDISFPVISGGISDVIRVKSLKGSNVIYAEFYDASKSIIGNTVIPYNEWSTIIVVVKSGVVSIYVNGQLDGTGTTTATKPLGDDKYLYTVSPCWQPRYAVEDQVAFKACQRNIRLYNRALSDEEIAELSGVAEETE